MSWESPAPGAWPGLSSLGMDEAILQVVPGGQTPAWLYRVSDNCVDCPWQRDHQVEANTTYTLHTHHPLRLLVAANGAQEYLKVGGPQEEEAICTTDSISLGEFGVYQLQVEDCSVHTLVEPVNGHLALLVWFLVWAGAALAWWAVKRAPGNPVGRLAGWLSGATEEQQKEEGGKQRLRSLDTFRGIAISLMIFVNDGGGGYWFMEHATWNGLYVADLVFPWFLWIMGVCIPMSVRSAIKKETPARTFIWGVTVRSVKLFMLGFILNTLGWTELARLRVPGVLQRFGVCYFVVSLVGWSLTRAVSSTRGGWARDILQLGPQWLVVLAILLVHQLTVFLVPAPGCQAGYSGPGGLHHWSPSTNNSGCIGGITGHLDTAFFSSQHIYGNPTAKAVYSASAFDPEGLLGSLTSIVQVFLGYQAGYILQVYPGHTPRLARWGCWSLATGALGTLLCGASQEGGWVPLNKNLWSISFVLVTSSFAFALLSLLYVLIDLKHWWKGQPFFYAGMNSILLYCGHQVGWQMLPFHWSVGAMRTHTIRLLEALWGVTGWLVVSAILYSKKVFITV